MDAHSARGVTRRSASSSQITEARTVSDRPPEPFSCAVETRDGRARLIPRGEIDLASIDELQSRLTEVRDGGYRRLLGELGGGTVMETTGVRLILARGEGARRDGIEVGGGAGSGRGNV